MFTLTCNFSRKNFKTYLTNKTSHFFFSTSASSQNFVEKPQLKIKTNTIDLTTASLLTQKDIPFFVLKPSSLKERTRLQKPNITTGELSYSSYKLNEACRLIRGRYIREAIEILNHQNTKGAKIVKKELTEYLERRVKEDEKKRNYLIKKKELKKIEAEEQKQKAEVENEAKEEDKNGENGENTNLFDFNNENNHKANIVEEVSERGDFLPYRDYKIAEAYVGRKIGHMVPSPRAKGRIDRIYRSISRLYIHIDKINEIKFYEDVAVGKAYTTFAKSFRQMLFTSNANLRTLRNFSFITTARGRYYRKIQFERMVTFLKDKYYKERGIKLNTEIIRAKLKTHLARQLAFTNPNNIEYLLSSNSRTEEERKINKQLYDKFNLIEDKKKEVIDKSYKARENEFNKNFKKVE